MTPAQKRGVLACWEILNKGARCAIDAALFAASMTGHVFKFDADDLKVEMSKVPTSIAGYTDMSDPAGENEGVTMMLSHLKEKGHKNLGDAASLRKKYAPPEKGAAPIVENVSGGSQPAAFVPEPEDDDDA